MARLLIVEESNILCGIFKRLLDNDGSFTYDIVETFAQAKELLSQYRYEYSVVSRNLSDAKDGEIIVLLNKHNVAPIVYTNKIDENFVETYEGAHIVEYILRHRYDNVKYVITRLKRLKENKQRAILIVHHSEVYKRYLKHNLVLHNFTVILVSNAYEAIHKLESHSNIDIMIVNNELSQVSGFDDIDGLELTRKVRKMKRDDLAIIALADKSNQYQTSIYLNEGANDYLINEYSRDELYTRIYQNLKN